MAKPTKINDWKTLWNNLNWGPRGALIAFVLTSLYLFIPLVPRVLINILKIVLVTLLGALAGALLETFLEQAKNKKT